MKIVFSIKIYIGIPNLNEIHQQIQKLELFPCLKRSVSVNVLANCQALYLFKKNLHILCSPSRAYYQTDFDDFRLKMTVEEWSKIHASKMRDFQSASLRKCNFSFHFRLQIAPSTAFIGQTFLCMWQYYCK